MAWVVRRGGGGGGRGGKRRSRPRPRLATTGSEKEPWAERRRFRPGQSVETQPDVLWILRRDPRGAGIHREVATRPWGAATRSRGLRREVVTPFAWRLLLSTGTCRRDWPGRKRRCPAGPGSLGGSGGGGGGEGWLRVSAGGRGGARQKGTSNASRSSVPRSQASARLAGPGLCQWARTMAPGGYSAMMTTGLSAGRWRTRLAAPR
jgi:hypothetical protein